MTGKGVVSLGCRLSGPDQIWAVVLGQLPHSAFACRKLEFSWDARRRTCFQRGQSQTTVDTVLRQCHLEPGGGCVGI